MTNLTKPPPIITDAPIALQWATEHKTTKEPTFPDRTTLGCYGMNAPVPKTGSTTVTLGFNTT